MVIPANALALLDRGELSNEETVALFQTLVDTGCVWDMPRGYRLMAIHLIKCGDVIDPLGENDKECIS